jgi:7-cyano-7-deazaguanine reductase
VPGPLCVELKSLKLYFQRFRDMGIYYEAATNQILDDLVGLLQPRWMKITTHWKPRGGMSSTVVAEHRGRGDKRKTR